MLRICLDVRNIKTVMTGVGRYARDLVRSIAELDSENEYILLTNPNFPERIINQRNFRDVPMAGDISSVRNTLTGSRIINALKPDVYHALSHYLPFGLSCPKKVITLHDLMSIETPHLSYPNPFEAAYNKHVKGWFQTSAVNRADIILAISEATRQRAIDVLGMPPQKSEVVYHGVSSRFNSEINENPTPRVSDVIRNSGRYIFSLGHTKPYKNVDGTIRAFRQVVEENPRLKLVVAGRGEGYLTLRQLTDALSLDDKVIFFSSPTDTDVIHLLRNAVCFSFPSFVEGFGLPIVEAMAVGCPVVTANISAPLEIAGDAALLVNPHDVDEIAAGFRQLLSNSSLRKKLIERGRDRAALFSTEQCARATRAFYTAPTPSVTTQEVSLF